MGFAAFCPSTVLLALVPLIVRFSFTILFIYYNMSQHCIPTSEVLLVAQMVRSTYIADIRNHYHDLGKASP